MSRAIKHILLTALLIGSFVGLLYLFKIFMKYEQRNVLSGPALDSAHIHGVIHRVRNMGRWGTLLYLDSGKKSIRIQTAVNPALGPTYIADFDANVQKGDSILKARFADSIVLIKQGKRYSYKW